MVFVVSIMAFGTFIAGTLMYIRVQNAVDTSADSFAANQARGLNLAQHLNDLHYDINWAQFVLESIQEPDPSGSRSNRGVNLSADSDRLHAT